MLKNVAAKNTKCLRYYYLNGYVSFKRVNDILYLLDNGVQFNDCSNMDFQKCSKAEKLKINKFFLI